jgi:hypothetical protein
MIRFTAWLTSTIDAFCTLQRIQFDAPWRQSRARRC